MHTLIDQRRQFARRHLEVVCKINGRRWGVISVGNRGPNLLLLPGTLGRADIYWQQIAALESRARILSLSYPASHNLAHWAQDLVGILDHFNIAKATISGSSLGGYLAQYFTAVYPERVAGLIAANTLASTAGLIERPPYAGNLAHRPIKLLRAGFAPGLKIDAGDQQLVKQLKAMLIGEVNGGIAARNLRARLLALKHAPKIGDIHLASSRIAVVESDDDPLISPAVRQMVREKLSPGISWRFITGGHFPYVLRPKAYLSILEQMLGLEQTGDNWGEGSERHL